MALCFPDYVLYNFGISNYNFSVFVCEKCDVILISSFGKVRRITIAIFVYNWKYNTRYKLFTLCKWLFISLIIYYIHVLVVFRIITFQCSCAKKCDVILIYSFGKVRRITIAIFVYNWKNSTHCKLFTLCKWLFISLIIYYILVVFQIITFQCSCAKKCDVILIYSFGKVRRITIAILFTTGNTTLAVNSLRSVNGFIFP